MFFSTTDKPRGQSLDGEALDVSLLDQRVATWKESLNLYHQDNFPPVNFPINAMGEKFHDRSHILLQDYAETCSTSFAQIYNESSLPSIYEEVLTYFCAQIVHKPGGNPLDYITPAAILDKIKFLRHIGYVPDGSVFLARTEMIALEISAYLQTLVADPDFAKFQETLQISAKDCPGWDRLDG